jgi:hypothetical protein
MPVWYHWGDPGRIAKNAWHWQKRISRKITEETMSTCGRELLRGWWRPISLMTSFIIFTSSVRNILDTPSYYWALPQNCEYRQTNSFIMSVRPSAWNNSAPN